MKTELQRSFLFLAQAVVMAVCSVAGAQPDTNSPATTTFEFKLPKESLTSAGIFDLQNRLVRVLWTTNNFAAGSHSASWDGTDEQGIVMPAGPYEWHVMLNGSDYRNVGAIGQNYDSPNAAGHVPSHMLSLATDRDGAVYTANGWDESGADFKKWDPSGKSIFDAHYQIRNGQPNGAPYAIAVDDQFIYCAMGGWAREPWNSRQQLQRFRLSDGQQVPFSGAQLVKPGHIQIYEWPEKQLPAEAPEAEADRLKSPLRALVVRGDTIFVADYLGNRILKFHKETGDPQGEFAVKQPQALAISVAGLLCVGHEHHKVSAFSTAGQLESELMTDLEEVEALAVAPDGRLVVADSGAGEVKMFDLTQRPVRKTGSLGQKAQPGDRAPDRFHRLVGVSVDPQGNIATIQNEPIAGARLARWSAEGKLLWEHFSNEFVSLGNYNPVDPTTFWSMSFHRYRLTDRKTGRWEYLNNCWAGGPRYHSDVHGVIRPVRLQGRDFVYMPTGDGVQIYRVDGALLKLCALVGGRDPTPEGKTRGKGAVGRWSWHDQSGTGVPTPESIQWSKKPEEKEAAYSLFGMDVDRLGHLWFAEHHSKAIWSIPLGGFDRSGNPFFKWEDAKCIVARDSSSLGFEPTMANRAEDGSIYALGWSKPWPAPKGNPFWMGGSTLVRFDAWGNRLWAVPLPETSVGMDTIPGLRGGCMVGGGKSATLYHFASNGLMLGSCKPGEAMSRETGWLDNHASVAVARDPRDHLLDVFTEDDYVLRIGWYRIDDGNVKLLSGKIDRK